MIPIPLNGFMDEILIVNGLTFIGDRGTPPYTNPRPDILEIEFDLQSTSDDSLCHKIIVCQQSNMKYFILQSFTLSNRLKVDVTTNKTDKILSIL